MNGEQPPREPVHVGDFEVVDRPSISAARDLDQIARGQHVAVRKAEIDPCLPAKHQRDSRKRTASMATSTACDTDSFSVRRRTTTAAG